MYSTILHLGMQQLHWQNIGERNMSSQTSLFSDDGKNNKNKAQVVINWNYSLMLDADLPTTTQTLQSCRLIWMCPKFIRTLNIIINCDMWSQNGGLCKTFWVRLTMNSNWFLLSYCGTRGPCSLQWRCVDYFSLCVFVLVSPLTSINPTTHCFGPLQPFHLGCDWMMLLLDEKMFSVRQQHWVKVRQGAIITSSPL